MKMKKKSLLMELKWTVLSLSAAMLVMWFLFYVNIQNVIQKNVMQNMELVSEQIISELNRSFLQLEEVSFALSQDTNVQNFLLEESSIEFVKKAAYVEKTIDKLSENNSFMENIILYNEQGRFYRFSGNIGNTGVRRMMNLVQKDKMTSNIQLKLDSVNYIGYVTAIYQEGERIGTIVMLTDENDIYRLLEQITDNVDMKIAIAADGKVILSNEEKYIGVQTANIRRDTTYMVYKQVFEHLKFDEKIAVLKNHLPTVLVKNKNVYGIVSKGIHELSEDECICMFPFIRTGIELILDDLLAEKERVEKEKLFETFVAQKTGELRQQ